MPGNNTTAWEFSDSSYGRELTLFVDWTDDLMPILEAEGIQSLVLKKLRTFKRDSLDFLEKLPHLTALTMLDAFTENIQGVHFLHQLRYLQTDDMARRPIDFSQLPLLEDCRMEFAKNRKSVANCRRLSSLWLQFYCYRDLELLSPLTDLRTLWLAQGSLSDIGGIEQFSNISELTLAFLRNLTNISPIGKLRQLETLSLEGCKKMVNIDGLASLKNLRRLDISKCGQIESLAPLLECESLEFIDMTGDTSVRDGDIRILNEVPSLKETRMTNRSHYNIKGEDLSLKD